MKTLILTLILASMTPSQPVSQPNWYPHVVFGNHTGTASIGRTTLFTPQVAKSCEVVAPILSSHMALSATLHGLKLWNRWGDQVYVNLTQDALFTRSTLHGNTPPLHGWGTMQQIPRGTAGNPSSITLPNSPALIGHSFTIQALAWEWFPSPPFQANWSLQFTTFPMVIRITS